jgi:hypothetical protein
MKWHSRRMASFQLSEMSVSACGFACGSAETIGAPASVVAVVYNRRYVRHTIPTLAREEEIGHVALPAITFPSLFDLRLPRVPATALPRRSSIVLPATDVTCVVITVVRGEAVIKRG